MRRAGFLISLVAVLMIASLSTSGGAHLKIALEDKLDTNPRQVALSTKIAGMCIGFVISWTDRLRRQGS